MVAGGEFTWTDIYDKREVVIVSENLARELWGTPAAALGKRIRHLPEMPWHEVIGVVQDVRGKHGSEGDYVMNRPLHGPQNPTPVDHSTDTYDTIEWLVKNVPESNGRVGILGISYDGFLPLMGLVNPHPALKVAVPMNPMVDGWMADDWFSPGQRRDTSPSMTVVLTRAAHWPVGS